jgi:O-antigen/teichoic acid export membrane protein
VLILATLLQSYQKQFTTTFNALDRPEIAFRVNLVFILSNVVLNVVLIIAYGWIGAAVATALSVGISLIIAYGYMTSILDFTIPVGEIAKQWIAAAFMAFFLIILIWTNGRYVSIGNNLLFLSLTIPFGAALYFCSLLGISRQFRTTVRDNLPDRIYSS